MQIGDTCFIGADNIPVKILGFHPERPDYVNVDRGNGEPLYVYALKLKDKPGWKG